MVPTTRLQPAEALVLVDGQNLECCVHSLGDRFDLHLLTSWLRAYGQPDIHWFQPAPTQGARSFLYEVERAGATVHQTRFKTLPDGKVKANCDSELIGFGMSRLYERPADRLVLIASDGDYADILHRYRRAGIDVVVIGHTPSLGIELRRMLDDDQFVELADVVAATRLIRRAA